MRFGVLGPLRAEFGGREVPLNGPRQAKMLAALLIGANQVVPVSRLVAAMWDGDGPATAVRQVQDAISGLRRNLAAAGAPATLISTHPGGYRIRLETDQLDLLAFDRERAADTVPGLRRALAHWRGPALAGLAGRLLEGEAARLNALRTAAHRRCLELELAAGRHREVAEELTALLHEHPHDEQLAEQTMLALYRGGRQGEALAVYQRIRRALADDLGVDPAPPLRALHQRVLNADPSLTPPAVPGPVVPRQLSSDLADFTGRDRLVARLETMLSGTGTGSPVVLSALDGAGGVGKTALAVHVAHRVLGHFPDGQLQADLHGAGDSPAEPGEVLARFLRGLGYPADGIPVDLEERAALYRSALAGRRLLVLLDNVKDTAQVRPLLPGAGTCAVLITSRSALPGLDGASRLTVGVLTPEEARELFTRIVGRELVDAEPEAVAEVLGYCAGLPLAVRIAASRLACQPGWTVRTLADRLRDEHRRLDELHVEDRAVRTSFAVGFRALPPADARAFGLLGLWRGVHITPPAAAALLAVTPDRAQHTLDTLARAHLVEAPGPHRYTLHDLLHVYAAERAAQDQSPGQRTDAVARLAGWYLQTSAAATGRLRSTPLRVDLPPAVPGCPPLDFADRAAALAWLETERPNLVTATEQAGQAELADLAWKLPVSLLSFFSLRKYWADWLGTYRVGLSAARQAGDPQGESRILNGLGIAHHDLNRNEEALAYYREALAVRRSSDDRLGQAMVLGNIGNTLQNLGRNEEAFASFEEAMAVSRAIGDRTTEANALNNLAHARLGLGQLLEAAESFRQAGEVYRAAGSAEGQAIALGNLGEAQLRLGEQKSAVRNLTRALELHRGLGNVYVEATVLVNLGNALCFHGQTPEGRRHWLDALDLLDRINDPRADRLRAKLAAVTPQTRSIRNLRDG